jgi:hypothetical protein
MRKHESGMSEEKEIVCGRRKFAGDHKSLHLELKSKVEKIRRKFHGF